MSISSPLQTEVANVTTVLIPNALVAMIAPFTASKVMDSTVPAFAIFFTCSYVKLFVFFINSVIGKILKIG